LQQLISLHAYLNHSNKIIVCPGDFVDYSIKRVASVMITSVLNLQNDRFYSFQGVVLTPQRWVKLDLAKSKATLICGVARLRGRDIVTLVSQNYP
jgi:hypothetical protein